RIAKTRSLHNNYLTLPVVFLMLSNHYPLAFGTQFNWVIAALVFLIGVVIRHYFNTVHARKGAPHWTWGAATVLFLAIVWLSTVPKVLTGEEKVSAHAETLMASAHFPAVRDAVMGRCAMCHAAEPVWDGVRLTPKGVMLETEAQMAERAREVYLQAGRSHAMPPGNVSAMTAQERALIVAWFEEARKCAPFSCAGGCCRSAQGRTASTTAPPTSTPRTGRCWSATAGSWRRETIRRWQGRRARGRGPSTTARI